MNKKLIFLSIVSSILFNCSVTYEQQCENSCKEDKQGCELLSSYVLFSSSSNYSYDDTYSEKYYNNNDTFSYAENIDSYIRPASSTILSASSNPTDIDIFYKVIDPSMTSTNDSSKIKLSLISGSPTCSLYSANAKVVNSSATPDATLTFIGNITSTGIDIAPTKTTYYYLKCTDTIYESYKIKMASNEAPPINTLGLVILSTCSSNYSSCIKNCRSGQPDKNKKKGDGNRNN